MLRRFSAAWLAFLVALAVVLPLASSTTTTQSAYIPSTVEPANHAYDAGPAYAFSDNPVIGLETAHPSIPPLNLVAKIEAAMSETAFAAYMLHVESLDVSTARNGTVLYSGQGNRALAEQFASVNQKLTLELTPGGSNLDAVGLCQVCVWRINMLVLNLQHPLSQSTGSTDSVRMAWKR